MFERNRIETAERAGVPVTLELEDGAVLAGTCIAHPGKTLAEIVNGPGGFLELETPEGGRQLLAKRMVRAVRSAALPKAPLLPATSDAKGCDPFVALGLEPGADWDSVRQRYVTLAKLYHPDRFGGVELPREVGQYLAGMARRINAAYTLLERRHEAEKAAEARRSSAIYTSPRRAPVPTGRL